jgi:DNA-binding MarR family transcriptional regulator
MERYPMPETILLDQLDRLTRRLQRNLECCDRALVTCCGLTVSQAHALLTLQEAGAITMNDFAGAMRLHGTTMTRMADALVEKGLVERQPAPEDRRIVRVVLSTQGQATAERVQQSKRQLLAEAFTGYTESEETAIVQMLDRLTTTVEKLANDCCAA